MLKPTRVCACGCGRGIVPRAHGGRLKYAHDCVSPAGTAAREWRERKAGGSDRAHIASRMHGETAMARPRIKVCKACCNLPHARPIGPVQPGMMRPRCPSCGLPAGELVPDAEPLRAHCMLDNARLWA